LPPDDGICKSEPCLECRHAPTAGNIGTLRAGSPEIALIKTHLRHAGAGSGGGRSSAIGAGCQRDKEARAAANCMVLHPACHGDPVEFYNLHGFYPDNLKRK
jgi:hypothetical protein